MPEDVLEVDTSIQQRLSPLRPRAGDIEAIRLCLTGGSVIDWHKAPFHEREEVDRHLALHLLDVHQPVHRARLDRLFSEAVTYVETYLGVRIPRRLREVEDLREIFVLASRTGGFRRQQVLCCTTLKLMHVMQHLEAADLRLRASISEAELLDIAHARISRVPEQMRREGIEVSAMYGSKKTHMSVVSKLLSKREDIANRIFDKLRYRLVVGSHDEIPRALIWLTRHLFPFNQVVPGQSHNNLLDPQHLPRILPPEERALLQELPADDTSSAARNLFSGQNFRMINIVLDLPIRLPDHALPQGHRRVAGDVVYVTVELQVVDALTARRNEEGDNAHAHYKQRQYEVVRQRLTRGMYLPQREE